MKLTESTLKQIIKEEILAVISEEKTRLEEKSRLEPLSGGRYKAYFTIDGITGVGIAKNPDIAYDRAQLNWKAKTKAADARSAASTKAAKMPQQKAAAAPAAAAASRSGSTASGMARLKTIFVDKGTNMAKYSSAKSLAATVYKDAPAEQKKAIASELSQMGFNVKELAAGADPRIIPGSPADVPKAAPKQQTKQQNQNKYMGMGTRTILKTLFPRLKIKDAFAKLKNLKRTHPARIAYRDAYGKGNRS